MTSDQTLARRAIEALRSGVPSRATVRMLGTTQTAIKQRFAEAIDEASTGACTQPIVVSGQFGSGKTHLLGYLQSEAERLGFVTSYLVVSPEAPLGNLHSSLKLLAESAKAPGHTGKALRELTTGDFTTASDAFTKLRRWARTAPIHDRFRAQLHLFEAYHADPEFQNAILNDFEGKPIVKTEIRRRLKEIGQAASYDLSSPHNAQLAPERLLCLSQFYKAAGCTGWVVLFDELEQLMKFTIRQRVAAYTSLGWWKRATSLATGIIPVFAMKDMLLDTVVEDEPRVSLFQQGVLFDDSEDLASAGISILKMPPTGVQMPIVDPTAEQIEDILYKVSSVYESAYDFRANSTQVRTSTFHSVRTEIRKAITGWDMMRYFGTDAANVIEEEIAVDTAQYSQEVLDGEDEDKEA